MDCIFCKIIKDELFARKVYEDNDFLVILDAFPANEGHLLIIPKQHFKNIFEMPDDILKNAYLLAKTFANKIKQNLNTQDINILQNNGKLAGQMVNHFHIHVIPRIANDSVTISSEHVELSEDRLNEIAEILRR